MGAEEWRAIPGWEGYYEASDAGRVRSVNRTVQHVDGRTASRTGRIIRPHLSGKAGYLQLGLHRDGVAVTRSVHTLVALAFLGPRPNGLIVCHNDGDRLNNATTNLRYDTYRANELDSVRHGTHPEASKTECPQGHPYDLSNTGWVNGRRGRSRYCRTCNADRCRERYQRRRMRVTP